MTQILYSGQTISLVIPSGQRIVISTEAGSYSASLTTGANKGLVLASNSMLGATFGPYVEHEVVFLSAGEGAIVSFEVGISPELDHHPVSRYVFDVNGNVDGFLAPDGSVYNPTNDTLTMLAADTGASLIGFKQSGTGAVSRTLDAKAKDTISVKDFGAVGDGVTNDTVAIQAALTSASATKKIVFFPSGEYMVSTITAPQNIAGIICEGAIKGIGTAPIATLVLGSDTNPVSGAIFKLKMNQVNGDLNAVIGNNTTKSTFVECQIYGFVNSATLNHYAIRMNGLCSDNIFANNHIDLYPSPTQRGFGIAVYGDGGTALPYGGFFDGVLSRAQYPAIGNTITGNVINDGSYAISLQSVEFSTVTGNYCRNQNHRSVYLANAAYGNTINSNVFLEYLSSAVVVAYGSSYNVVSNNYCETATVGGEAAMNINTGARFNLIDANRIKSPTNYGVYMGCDMVGNVVSNNYIENQYLAGIFLENDWIDPLPANASFSRPNYATPPSPYTAWSTVNSSDNVITNNTIHNGYSGRNTTAIGVAQIDAGGLTSIVNNVITNNTVTGDTNVAYNLHFYKNDNAKFTGTVLTNNNFNPNNTELSASTAGATTWNNNLSFFGGNREIDDIINAETIMFTDLDATPSVATNSSSSIQRLYSFANYTSPTNITNFIGGVNSQTIMIRLSGNITIVYASGVIKTKGSVNIAGGSTNNLIQFTRISGIWFETWRNF